VENASGFFSSFNARHLDAEQIAKTFVPSLRFTQLLALQNSLLVGARGSGKTHMLKMLQPKALNAWSHEDSRFYADYHWRHAAMRFGTSSAAHRIIELAAHGRLSHDKYDWDLTHELANLIASFPDVRAQVYRLLESDTIMPGRAVLARALSESPDEDSFLLLVRLEQEQKIDPAGDRAIERVFTKNVPIEGASGAYDVVAIAANGLRQRLLAMTTDGGKNDVAARYLRIIDEYRDRYGKPEAESRHPDFASGRQWPILRPDPDAEGLPEAAPN
jgi:hypothetical protein